MKNTQETGVNKLNATQSKTKKRALTMVFDKKENLT